MADKGPVDEKLKQAITEIEAQHYKVVTKEEYNHLMALHVTKVRFLMLMHRCLHPGFPVLALHKFHKHLVFPSQNLISHFLFSPVQMLLITHLLILHVCHQHITYPSCPFLVVQMNNRMGKLPMRYGIWK